MKKALAGSIVAMGFGLAPEAAFAQEASQEVKRICRGVATDIARVFTDAKKRGVRDLEAGIYRASNNWAEQVAIYMAQVANRSDSISEGELVVLGTAYCVERRPAGK